MAESINCDICTKLATVHLTQIVNGKIHKIDLCETCAKEKGVTDPNGLSDIQEVNITVFPSPPENLRTEP